MAWAFWNYDTLPYLLGDEIKEYDSELNKAKLVNYGGMIVHPRYIIEDNAEGLKRWLEIRSIGNSVRTAITMLKKSCRMEVKEIIVKPQGNREPNQ